MFEELKKIAEDAEEKAAEFRAEFNAAVLGHPSPKAIKAEAERAKADEPTEPAKP